MGQNGWWWLIIFKYSVLSQVMVREIPKLCLLVATLAVGSAVGACERGRSWWDGERGTCVDCTRCEPLRLAVRVPCELHRDTICQPLHEINFDISTTDNEPSEQFSEIEYYDDYTDYYGEVSEDESEKWNLQTTTLSLAICGCVLFFVVVLYLTFYHSKQWRVLKQALKLGKLWIVGYM